MTGTTLTMIRVESHLGATRSTPTSLTCKCGQTFPAFRPEGHPEKDHYESPGWTVHARRHGDVMAWWAGEPRDSAVMLRVVGVEHVSEEAARRQVEERYGESEVDAAVAMTIASWWQSSGPLGRSHAALASGAPTDVGDLLVEIHSNRNLYVQPDSPDARALDMLCTWLIRVTDDKER